MRKAGRPCDSGPLGRASMGPQLDSCGRLLHAAGAAGPMPASMGPQLDSCGRIHSECRVAIISMELQWGRNLTVAEGNKLDLSLPRRHVLQWGRNLTVAEGGGAHGPHNLELELQWGRNLTVAEGGMQGGGRRPPAMASMGPQLDSCGRCSPTSRPPTECRFNGAAT